MTQKNIEEMERLQTTIPQCLISNLSQTQFDSPQHCNDTSLTHTSLTIDLCFGFPLSPHEVWAGSFSAPCIHWFVYFFLTLPGAKMVHSQSQLWSMLWHVFGKTCFFQFPCSYNNITEMCVLKFVGPVAGITTNFPASSLCKFCAIALQIYNAARSHACWLWIFMFIQTSDHCTGNTALDTGRSDGGIYRLARNTWTSKQSINQGSQAFSYRHR